MLKSLRDASNKPLAKVLMGVLMFSFVGWGVAGWVFGENRHDDSVVKIGREPITLAQFDHERSRQLSQMSREQQRQIYTDRAAGVDFNQQILSNLAASAMMDQRAEDLGMSVTNAGIAAAIRSEPAFQENGKFSAMRFDYVLSSSNLSEAAFAEYIRRSILRDMVTGGIASGLPVPDFVVTAMYNARNASRKIEFARVAFGDFDAGGNPTDESLRQVHAKNPKTVPEYRTVSVILVPADVSKPDEVDKAFAIAQKLEDAIIAGESMADAAAARKAKFINVPAVDAKWKTKDGKLFDNAALNDEIRRLAFTLDQGVESEILETKSGFAIVRVESMAPAHIAEFDSVRDELVGLWRTEQRKVKAYERANEILIAANKDKKSVGNAVTVTRTKGAPLEVLSAAFQTPVGVNTIVPGANAFYVLSVRESIMPKMDETQKLKLRTEAAAMMTRTLRDDYSAFLSRKYPVKVNNRMFKRLFGE
ncbi:MAG: SurA N-terminal domain-containing protein [Alphaproteobacteria bacterium]|nr:SurA N-terminal domain-containing protein [Alphaproteobacteria bacterium]